MAVILLHATLLLMATWYLYLAQAKTGIYYAGISTDPERRLKDHNNGKGSSLAKAQGPFTLRYVSPPLPDHSTARKLEIKIKKWPRRQKQQLIDQKIGLPTVPPTPKE